MAQPAAKTPKGGLEPGAPPLQLQSLPPDGHTLTPAEQAKLQREREYRLAIRLATLEARWGAPMSTPGVTMSLVETGRSRTAAGATEIAYQIAASGFRPGERLNLIEWPLGEPMRTVMGGLTVNAQGRAVCTGPGPAQEPSAPTPDNVPGGANGGQPAAAPARPAAPSCRATMKVDQPVEIETTAAPGQAIRAALVGEDRSNDAAAEAVPFPIEDTDQGCRLQVLLGVKDADLVVVRGEGFPANAILTLDTVTGTKDEKLRSQSNAKGQVAFAVMPFRQGQPSGTTTVRFSGVVHPPALKAATAAAPDPTCAPAVSFHWGQGAYKLQ